MPGWRLQRRPHRWRRPSLHRGAGTVTQEPPGTPPMSRTMPSDCADCKPGTHPRLLFISVVVEFALATTDATFFLRQMAHTGEHQARRAQDERSSESWFTALARRIPSWTPSRTLRHLTIHSEMFRDVQRFFRDSRAPQAASSRSSPSSRTWPSAGRSSSGLHRTSRGCTAGPEFLRVRPPPSLTTLS